MKGPKIAIYIRLSKADEDTRYSKTESGSIQHQRMLLHDYLDHHEELKSSTDRVCGSVNRLIDTKRMDRIWGRPLKEHRSFKEQGIEREPTA